MEFGQSDPIRSMCTFFPFGPRSSRLTCSFSSFVGWKLEEAGKLWTIERALLKRCDMYCSFEMRRAAIACAQPLRNWRGRLVADRKEGEKGRKGRKKGGPMCRVGVADRAQHVNDDVM